MIKLEKDLSRGKEQSKLNDRRARIHNEMRDSMKWVEVHSYDEMSQVAAQIFEQQLQTKPNSVLGLATGASPVGLYRELVKRHQQGAISFEQVVTFNLDEYVGVPKTSLVSYWTYMHEHLFHHVNINVNNIHIPNSEAEDIDLECQQFEEKIIQAGGIDLQLLGIGVNGHIGFNEPGTPFDSVTHIVKLEETTRTVNAKYFDRLEDVPTYAMTMGIQSILNAKAIVLIAFGENKLEAMERLKSGIVTEDFPASCLLKHPNVTIIYGGTSE